MTMVLQVEDWIRRAGIYGRKAPTRNPDDIDFVVAHRHGTYVPGWGVITNAKELARLHGTHPDLMNVTGRAAYDFCITENGSVQQLLATSTYGAHAMEYNRISIGIAVLGDFRKRKPEPLQWESLKQLTTVLCGRFTAKLFGHSELVSNGALKASKSKDKRLGGSEECPGEHLDLDALRQHVTDGAACYELDAFGIR